jgi:hypothetical protein
MIELDEGLQRLADSVGLPPTSPQDDLAAGRARRRHRSLGVAAAALTTAAVIGSSFVLLSGGSGHRSAQPGFAGSSGQTHASDTQGKVPRNPDVASNREEALQDHQNLVSRLEGLSHSGSARNKVILSGYRDVLREDLDPAGARIQTGKITNMQVADDSLGTKLDWNDGGMLQIAVGRSLEGVQFFCDGGCTERSVAGASRALVLSSGAKISVAVFQDDGDIVALTADTSFGNNGTSTGSLGLTVDQLLAAAADPRLDLPARTRADQLDGLVGTQ